VRDAGAVRRAAEGCDVVVDNAALVPVTRAGEAEYRAVNVDGCRNTLEAAADVGAYAVHISSSAIFGVPRELPVRPDSELAPFEPYGRSKADADRLTAELRAGGQPVASLRPRTLLGAGRLGLFDVIFSRVRAGKAVPMFGRGHNHVQMCDVEDFCAAALAAIERQASGDYNIGAPGFGTVRDDLGELIRHAGTGARLLPVPVAAIKAVLLPLDAIGRSPFNEWHWRSAPKPFYFDISKARSELGWEPRRSNAAALANAYDHYLRREDAGGSAHLQPLRGGLARVLRG
jgi:nucleoside-diphosphate-sugar epimerase